MNKKISAIKKLGVISIVAILILTILIFNVMRFSSVTAAEEIIVDNPDATFVGYWRPSAYQPGYIGTNYMFAAAGDGSATCTWSFTVSVGGEYEVFARWTSSSNRATNAPYTVYSADSPQTIRINQEANGGTWYSLGTYYFTSSHSVVLSNDANQYVIADAIRLVSTGTQPPGEVNYLSISPSAFTPSNGDIDYYKSDMWIQCDVGFGPDPQQFFAPVQFPNGSRITGMTLFYFDNGPIALQCFLERWDPTEGSVGTLTTMAGAWSSGDSGNGVAIGTVYNSETVDNSRQSFHLKLQLPSLGAILDLYQCRQVIIEYVRD